MKREKRAAAVLLSFIIALFLFTSSAYIVQNAGHTCSGEHCEVCDHIHEYLTILHGFALVGGAMLSVYTVLPLLRVLCTFLGLSLNPRRTLVSWKVRLDD